jgi:hypothetical protein
MSRARRARNSLCLSVRRLLLSGFMMQAGSSSVIPESGFAFRDSSGGF